MRIRATTHGDTPLPPEEPAARNPPPAAGTRVEQVLLQAVTK